jgi:hypothetical protein
MLRELIVFAMVGVVCAGPARAALVDIVKLPDGNILLGKNNLGGVSDTENKVDDTSPEQRKSSLETDSGKRDVGSTKYRESLRQGKKELLERLKKDGHFQQC